MIESVIKKTNMYYSDSSLNNLLNIIPSLKNKSILFIGKSSSEIIDTILNYDCELFILEQKEMIKIKSKQSDSLEQCKSLQVNKYDFCIIVEPDILLGNCSFSTSRKIFHNIFKCLSESGILFIGNLKFIRSKIFIKFILDRGIFNKIENYYCLPSIFDPQVIYPLSQDRKYTVRIITENFFKNWTLKILFKNIVKYFFVKTTSTLNPFMDTILIARKSTNSKMPSIKHRTINCEVRSFLFDYRKLLPSRNGHFNKQKINIYNVKPNFTDLYIVWLSKGSKYVGLGYSKGKNGMELVKIIKKCNVNSKHYENVYNQYKITNLLNEYKNEFKNNSLDIPLCIYFEKNSENITFIESPVKGKILSTLRRKFIHKNSYHKYEFLIDGFIDKQNYMHRFLSENIKDLLPVVPCKYFINNIDKNCKYLNDYSRYNNYSANVQHGDFTIENLLYNNINNTWGVIDFEWMARGYPFMFDLFYLIISIEYREITKINDVYIDRCFVSFVDTFFRVNWYSKKIKNILIKYCDQNKITYERIYDYLLDTLLLTFNRIYYSEEKKDYSELYRKMLCFSLKNKHNFIGSSAESVEILRFR